MKRERVWLRQSLVVAALLSGVSCGPRARVERTAAPLRRVWRPNQAARDFAAKISLNRVQRLEVTGTHFLRFSDAPIKVEDRSLIRAFHEALRKSERLALEAEGIKEVGLADKSETLTFIERASSGKGPAQHVFHFNARTANSELGADFVPCLQRLKVGLPRDQRGSKRPSP